MSQLKARCIDQVLIFENTPVITSGNVNYDSILFDFCSAWDGFTKTAIFYRSEDEVFYQLLDGSNTCIIPKEVLREKGDVYIGVFGVSGDTTLTSQVLKYKITKGAITEDLKPADPTPDIYEQIISRYDAVIEELEEQFQKLEDLQNQFTGSIGNADTLDGHESDYFATAESVTNLENGTTKAGKAKEADNASKLGGYAASYFAPSEYLGGSRIYTSLPTGITKENTMQELLDALTYSAILTCRADSPLVPEDYTTLTVMKVTPSYSIAFAKSQIGNNVYMGSTGSANTWGGWTKYTTINDLAKYFPLTGGKLTGDTEVVKDTNSVIRLKVGNIEHIIGLSVDTEGSAGLYDYTLGDWVLKSYKSGERTFYGTASGNLPKNDNGHLTGNSHTPFIVDTTYSDDFVRIGFYRNGEVRGHLGIMNGNPTFTNTSYAHLTLHHDGNSARVHIGTSAPSDTSALWIDTTA